MSYEVTILPRARKQLERIEEGTYRRILEALEGLQRDARPPGCRKLRGREGWRVRIGEYRVIYLIDDERRLVTILDVDHRRQVYR